MPELCRYSRITTKLPREFLLLQGQGCAWRRCAFCDYYTDVSENPFAVNLPVLRQVTGEFGVLDVINSGSASELDSHTMEALAAVVQEKGIHTLWFESHWMYRQQLAGIAAKFPTAQVKFRCGVESFDPDLRESWQKGIPRSVTPEEVAAYFKGVCLLIGVQGQTREGIRCDVQTAQRLFEYFSVNAFVENSTPLRRDEALVQWFADTLLPELKEQDGVEVLLYNTDLGVG